MNADAFVLIERRWSDTTGRKLPECVYDISAVVQNRDLDIGATALDMRKLVYTLESLSRARTNAVWIAKKLCVPVMDTTAAPVAPGKKMPGMKWRKKRAESGMPARFCTFRTDRRGPASPLIVAHHDPAYISAFRIVAVAVIAGHDPSRRPMLLREFIERLASMGYLVSEQYHNRSHESYDLKEG